MKKQLIIVHHSLLDESIFPPCIKTRTSLMNIRTELIVTHDLCFGIQTLQNGERIFQSYPLGIGTGICGDSGFVQTAFIANADAVEIKTFGMRSGLTQRAGMMHFTITGDIQMITDAVEATPKVALAQLLYGEGSIAARCAAMDHEKFDFSG